MQPTVIVVRRSRSVGGTALQLKRCSDFVRSAAGLEPAMVFPRGHPRVEWLKTRLRVRALERGEITLLPPYTRMERTVWTDARMDDAMTRIDQSFDRIEDRMERSFDRVWDEFRELRGQIVSSNRQLTQIGWALVGILLVQLIAAVVALC